MRMAVSPETVCHINHELQQVHRLGDPGGGAVHGVFEAPALFGIPKIQLDLELPTIVVHE